MRRKFEVAFGLALLVPFIYICLEYLRYFRNYSGASFTGKDNGWGW